MEVTDLTGIYSQDKRTIDLLNRTETLAQGRLRLQGLIGSSLSFLNVAIYEQANNHHIVVLPDKESAAYFLNDLESIFGEKDQNFHKKRILFFPTSYKRSYNIESQDNTSILLRTEVLKRLGTSTRKTIIVTYPEALTEKVVRKAYLTKNTIKVKVGEKLSHDFVADVLIESDFERTDFVYEPGQFALRGGIIDVFSYTNDYPYRIEFFGDEVESIRSFNPNDQLSIDKLDHISIVPNIQDRRIVEKRESVLSFIPENTLLWFDDLGFTIDRIGFEYDRAKEATANEEDLEIKLTADELYIDADTFKRDVLGFTTIEFGSQSYFPEAEIFKYDISPQPSFNKNFDILIGNLTENTKKGIQNYILSENPNQLKRLYAIFDDVLANKGIRRQFDFDTVSLSMHQGFVDHDHKIACYTDHQIFERYHKFHLKEKFSGSQALTLKELYNLQPGDYVTHIDHGVGRFDGLEKIESNGKMQEAIRLIYKDGDLLYISIHSLHRISKFVGKEGTSPTMNRLGSNAWNKLKEKTKRKSKTLPRSLLNCMRNVNRPMDLGFHPILTCSMSWRHPLFMKIRPISSKLPTMLKRTWSKNIPWTDWCVVM